MYSQILSTLIPVMACIAIGYSWQKLGFVYHSDFVGNLVMKVGTPCLVVSALSKVPINIVELTAIAQLVFAIVAVVGLISLVVLKLKQLKVRTYLNSFVFSNVGNMGLPLCLFAFGDKGLALGLAYFMLHSVVHFTFGIALVSPRSAWSELLTNPIVLSVLVALAMIFTGWHLPLWLENTTQLIGGFVIPLMLITLGVSLAGFTVKHLALATELALYKMLIGLMTGLLVTWLFDAQGVLRGVVLLQAAMPVAVFNFIIAQKYQRETTEIASLVIVSTALSFIVLPPLLWWVM